MVPFAFTAYTFRFSSFRFRSSLTGICWAVIGVMSGLPEVLFPR